MAIAFVQQNQAQATANATTIAATFGSNTTTGNLILVGFSNSLISSSKGYVGSISDGSNTYMRLGQVQAGANSLLEIWSAKNITGGVTPTVTITFAGATTRGSIDILEVSGLALNQPVDYFASVFEPGTAGKFSIDSVSPRSANNLVYFYVTQNTTSVTTFVVGSGFTNLQQQNSATSGVGASARQIQINAPQSPLSSSITGGINNTTGIVGLVVLSDTNLPPFKLPLLNNNYQQFKVSNGMSTSEKIR